MISFPSMRSRLASCWLTTPDTVCQWHLSLRWIPTIPFVTCSSGDRFLLCTDGVTEPENASGDFFGDARLEQVIRENQSRPPSELSDKLLAEIRNWQPTSVSQQDDITLLVIDLV